MTPLPVGRLRLLCGAVLAVMLAVTVAASLERSVWAAAAALWPDPWFRATLADAYLAFLTVYAWVLYREATWAARIAWLVLFLALGNLAIAAYILLRLARLGPRPTVADLLLRPADRP